MEFNLIDGYDDFADNSASIVTYTVNGVTMSEAEFAQRLREKYMKNPPIGYSSKEISRMKDNDILDMDYFLNE